MDEVHVLLFRLNLTSDIAQGVLDGQAGLCGSDLGAVGGLLEEGLSIPLR